MQISTAPVQIRDTSLVAMELVSDELSKVFLCACHNSLNRFIACKRPRGLQLTWRCSKLFWLARRTCVPASYSDRWGPAHAPADVAHSSSLFCDKRRASNWSAYRRQLVPSGWYSLVLLEGGKKAIWDGIPCVNVGWILTYPINAGKVLLVSFEWVCSLSVGVRMIFDGFYWI